MAICQRTPARQGCIQGCAWKNHSMRPAFVVACKAQLKWHAALGADQCFRQGSPDQLEIHSSMAGAFTEADILLT